MGRRIPVEKSLHFDACKPGAALSDRFDAWIGRLEKNEPQGTIRQVYGGYWFRHVPVLDYLKTKIDFRVWALSGGYGLLNENQKIVPYHATLAEDSKIPDRVSDSLSERVEWWRWLAGWRGPYPLQPRRLRDIVDEADHTIVVAGSSYQHVLEADQPPAHKITYVTAKPRTLPANAVIKSDAVLGHIIPVARSWGLSNTALALELTTRVLHAPVEGIHDYLAGLTRDLISEAKALKSSSGWQQSQLIEDDERGQVKPKRNIDKVEWVPVHQKEDRNQTKLF